MQRIETGIEGTFGFHTPKQTQQVINPKITIQGVTTTQDIEIISTYPNSKIVLKIEEIPPLDIFYSWTHKAVIRRQTKKRKIDASTTRNPEKEPMEVVWKDTPIDQLENLTRLSQFVGAYANATMDKETKFHIFFKEKEEII